MAALPQWWTAGTAADRWHVLVVRAQVVGFPSKEVGLFIRQSIIFRSDSNGEDLEGYAGAGLYDRCGTASQGFQA